MAPLVIPLVVATAAAGTTALIQKKAAEKQADAAKETAQAQTRSITLAEQQQKAEEEQDKKIFAENLELQKKQLVLEANRNRIETLASLRALKQRERPIVVSSAPQPVRKLNAIDRINLFIESLF